MFRNFAAIYTIPMQNYKDIIEEIWEHRELLKEEKNVKIIEEIIESLDKGKLRVAEPVGNAWQVNDWIKKAVILSPKALFSFPSNVKVRSMVLCLSISPF